MKDLELEKILRQWAEDLVSRYTWLTIRFEYSEKEGVYLVSYYPEWKIERDTDFVRESAAFEDRMNDLYDEFSAPLFCYEEKLFKLSHNAAVIRCSKPEPTLYREARKKRRPQLVEEPMEV